jgi:hypothetical protein
MEDQSFQARMKIHNPKLLQLYSFPTPNGVKVAAALEEIIELKSRTGKSETLPTPTSTTNELFNVNTATSNEEERVLLYEPHAVNIRSGENRLKWYCQLGFHNHKIPGLIDPECLCTGPCPESCPPFVPPHLLLILILSLVVLVVLVLILVLNQHVVLLLSLLVLILVLILVHVSVK